jgi:uncharacterized protein YjhX (UPF0386 family)
VPQQAGSIFHKGENMTISKAQLKIISELQNGAHIWLASNKYAFIVTVSENNGVKSSPLHGRAFNALKEKNIIKEIEVQGKHGTRKQWVLA